MAKEMRKRPATGEDLLCILRQHTAELQDCLGLESAQFSLPTDGAGLRIQVAVPEASGVELPSEVEYQLDDELVTVPIEVSEDYQEYKLHSNSS